MPFAFVSSILKSCIFVSCIFSRPRQRKARVPCKKRYIAMLFVTDTKTPLGWIRSCDITHRSQACYHRTLQPIC